MPLLVVCHPQTHTLSLILRLRNQDLIGRFAGHTIRPWVSSKLIRTWTFTDLNTAALTKLEPDWWFELEDTYVDRIKQRRALYDQFGKSVLDTMPGSELACKELMEISLQFLCARYPQYFILDRENLMLSNTILNRQSNLKTTPPLEILLDNVPEDFAIMLRDPKTGHYHFRAGVICSALGWNVATKLGKKLHEIHEPIPDYKEKMQFSMDRYVTA
jgi:hypothetical protein